LPPSKTPGVTGVHEARGALGQRLRELRQQAGLSGLQLAGLLTWPASKVSKLELGRQAPTDHDIRCWTEATGSTHEAAALLASLHTLEVRHAEWQRQLRAGLRPHQKTLDQINSRTRFFRAFEPTFIPGLLQTEQYARSRFAQSSRVFSMSSDVDAAVEARLRSQDILYQAHKRFHFVLTEAALRYRLCPPAVMLGQLDRLVAGAGLPTVKLGIIGFGTDYAVAPAHGFWLHDDDRVIVETFSAELNLAQPQEIELYGRVFEQLAASASYGRQATAILTRVIADLAAEVAENDE
jgi:transcriptional regulator with XRE-family HTH domain